MPEQFAVVVHEAKVDFMDKLSEHWSGERLLHMKINCKLSRRNYTKSRAYYFKELDKATGKWVSNTHTHTYTYTRVHAHTHIHIRTRARAHTLEHRHKLRKQYHLCMTNGRKPGEQQTTTVASYKWQSGEVCPAFTRKSGSSREEQIMELMCVRDHLRQLLSSHLCLVAQQVKLERANALSKASWKRRQHVKHQSISTA